eukprot:5623688-Pyramimonas_sp.AAC.1
MSMRMRRRKRKRKNRRMKEMRVMLQPRAYNTRPSALRSPAQPWTCHDCGAHRRACEQAEVCRGLQTVAADVVPNSSKSNACALPA